MVSWRLCKVVLAPTAAQPRRLRPPVMAPAGSSQRGAAAAAVHISQAAASQAGPVAGRWQRRCAAQVKEGWAHVRAQPAPIVHRPPAQSSPLKARRSSRITHLVEQPAAGHPNEGKGGGAGGKEIASARALQAARCKPTTVVGPVRARTGSSIYGFGSFRVLIL